MILRTVITSAVYTKAFLVALFYLPPGNCLDLLSVFSCEVLSGKIVLPFPGMNLEEVVLPRMRKLEKLCIVKTCLFGALENRNAVEWVLVEGEKAFSRKISSAYPSKYPPKLSYIWNSLKQYCSACSGEAAFCVSFSKRFCVYGGSFFLCLQSFFQFSSSGIRNVRIKDAHAALLKCIGAYVTLQILIGMIAYILPSTVTWCIVLNDLKNSHVREMF